MTSDNRLAPGLRAYAIDVDQLRAIPRRRYSAATRSWDHQESLLHASTLVSRPVTSSHTSAQHVAHRRETNGRRHRRRRMPFIEFDHARLVGLRLHSGFTGY
jgi:hypothetical protein